MLRVMGVVGWLHNPFRACLEACLSNAVISVMGLIKSLLLLQVQAVVPCLKEPAANSNWERLSSNLCHVKCTVAVPLQ